MFKDEYYVKEMNRITIYVYCIKYGIFMLDTLYSLKLYCIQYLIYAILVE